MSVILVTGAAGKIAKVLRPALREAYGTVRLADIKEVGDLAGGETFVRCDVRDLSAVAQAVEGADAVIHLAASLSVNDWDEILQANIAGTYNVYEAARRKGVSRIVYASSNHAIGMHPREARLDLDAPLRPDSFYGISKTFGENLSRYYFDKFGIESACIRIGSALPRPNDERALSTWLSEPDMVQLFMRCLEVPILGWTPVYGVSDNNRNWWDNGKAGYLGYRPKDNAEDFAPEILSRKPAPDPADPAVRHQGGVRSAHGYVPDDERPTRRRKG